MAFRSLWGFFFVIGIAVFLKLRLEKSTESIPGCDDDRMKEYKLQLQQFDRISPKGEIDSAKLEIYGECAFSKTYNDARLLFRKAALGLTHVLLL